MTHRGYISEIIFRNEDNGYTVALFETTDDTHLVVGHLPGVSIGERLVIHGEEVEHPRYGWQFSIESFESDVPDDLEGIMAFLSSGQFPGIGEKMAKRIVDLFGEETLERIDEDPQVLLQVPGIGKKTFSRFLEAYEEVREKRSDILLLGKIGVPSSHINAILREIGPGAGHLVKENPYLLYGRVSQMRFSTIDEMALRAGIEKKDPRRIRAFIVHALVQALGEGHCALPKENLLQRLYEGGIEEEDLVLKELRELLITGALFEEEEMVYLRHTYRAQSMSASHLVRLLREGPAPMMYRKRALHFEAESKLRLGEDQWEALEQIFREPLSILSGGPGTGKTTLVRCLVHVAKQAGLPLLLAAPTGRAAKRMEEATGEEARTIHRLLEFQYAEEGELSFARNEENPLECELLIIDEFSMVDIFLFHSLVEAIPSQTRVVFIGDKDQLPSVGAGNVLADLLACEPIASLHLQRIYRQTRHSLIPYNAKKILEGDADLLQETQGDFFFLRETPQRLSYTLRELLEERLVNYYGLDALRDIQVLTPMRRGSIGSLELNKSLQSFLNPPDDLRAELPHGDRIFRVGDKVMQVKNNYLLEWVDTESDMPGKGVFNGELGELIGVSRRELTILFDGTRLCRYPLDKLMELEHAYAMTIHKSQGSEFPCVVLIMGWAAPMLMNRNVLYTGVTRGKRLVILLGEKRVLHVMVKGEESSLRFSGLQEAFMKQWERSDKMEQRHTE